MKRPVVAILLLVLAAARPATTHALGLDLGIKGGASISKIQSDLLDVSNRTGFVGGGSLGIALVPGFVVQPEVLFVRKGAKLPADLGSGTIDVDYLEIPLLLRLSLLPVHGPVDLRVLGGPVASFRSSGTPSLAETRADLKKIKDADYGVAVGGALAFQPGGLRIVAEGRYTFGLAKVLDLASGDEGKNRAIYVMLGVELPLFGQ
jgi:hypothetical protein